MCKINHDEELTVPRFLCRRCTPRPAGAGHNLGPAMTEVVDPVAERQKELRAMHEADRTERRRASLARHLDRHRFETWDSKLKMWVRDEAKIAAHHAALEAEAM